MNRLIHAITDRVVTRKGVWITLGIWLLAIVLLTALAPTANDYKVTSVSELLPSDMQAEIASSKIDEYFEDSDAISAILVFQAKNAGEEIAFEDVSDFVQVVSDAKIEGVKEVVPLWALPPQAVTSFVAENNTAAFVPITLEANLDTNDIKVTLEEIYALATDEASELQLYITGPAGIAVDTTDLFTRADFVLMFSTIGIILILLIVTYRSPLLALIPLLSAGLIYQVVNQVLGLMGKAGVELGNQSISIMLILLFAVVIDYSLFIFSRFREELKKHEDKYEAMRLAMREIGVPIFYSASTIILAMLILFFAHYGDYRNFAPIFSVAVFIVLIGAITLVPTLFTIFGRSSFWPKIPRVGDAHIKDSAFWSRVGRFVTKRPIISVLVVGIFLLLSASNVLNMTYEFDTMKSFPDDMPSRIGYEILEDNFAKGDLAPTKVLFEASDELSDEEISRLSDRLAEEDLVEKVRVDRITDDQQTVLFELTFSEGPYDTITMEAFDNLRENAEKVVDDSELSGTLYFAGETANVVDTRDVSNRDLTLIVILETLLIFAMLIFLTRSVKIPIFMMGTILLSFIAALGLGIFLTDFIFDIDTVSNRVPVYAFIFLVALGIDYNIFLVSRYLEEKSNYSVRDAVRIAVSNTGGVISSAGIVLAATFAVLMTQPVEVLFVFGFIVAVGILLDTFLIRGIIMPGLLVLFERDKKRKQSA